MKNVKYCACHIFCMGNTFFAFSKPKKSTNLLEILQQKLVIRIFEVLALKLLFLKFFVDEKLARKLR